MKLSQKDKYLLTGLIGLLFFIIAWFLIASPIKEKTAQIASENVGLQSTAELYTAINARLDEYQGEITTLKAKQEDILSQYPSNMIREDEIMFWANLENAFPETLAVSSLSMSNWEEVLPVQEEAPQPTEETADDTTADAAATDAAATTDATAAADAATAQATADTPMIHLYRAPINYNYTATYRGLKNMLNYLYLEGGKKNVENLSIAFDSSTGNLSGNIDLNLFYMTGTGKDYQPISVPAVQKGVSDVFHTVEGAGLTPEDVQTDVTEETVAEE